MVLAPLALIAGVATQLPTANAAAPAAGWQALWTDDFTGSAGTLPAAASWQIDTGHNSPGGPANWGTGEIESYEAKAENVSLDGTGNLKITATKDASGTWHSSRIETQRSDFRPPTGGSLKIESSMKLPDGGQGYWPAFWMLGAPIRDGSGTWPNAGEIDIMENIGKEPNAVHGTLHCGVNPGGPCNESVGVGSTYNSPNGQPFSAGFHTYSVVWSDTPAQLQWFVDGHLIHTVTPSTVGQSAWDNATNHGYFLLYDLALGGAWAGNPDATTMAGRSMLIDYVSVSSIGSAPVLTTTTVATTAKPTTTSTTRVAPAPVVTTTTVPAPPAPVTTTSIAAPGPTSSVVSARSHIQAESFAQSSGIGVEGTTDADGGKDVGWIANGDWLLYKNVDFGTKAATQFYGRSASAAPSGASGLVEVRLDSLNAQPVAAYAIANTGGWQAWRTVPMNMKPVTGKHDVYITFTSGQKSDYVNLNWISFA